MTPAHSAKGAPAFFHLEPVHHEGAQGWECPGVGGGCVVTRRTDPPPPPQTGRQVITSWTTTTPPLRHDAESHRPSRAWRAILVQQGRCELAQCVYSGELHSSW